MGKIIPFPQQESNDCTLRQWVDDNRDEESMKTVFLYMDVAMRYIHEDLDCFIGSFSPKDIFVLDNDPKKIKFMVIYKMPDGQLEKDKIKQEDIFRASLIQIGLYTNTIDYLNPEFLVNNFDEFARFIPEGIVAYYRGVIQRGSPIYLSEFSASKAVRDLEELKRQVDGESQSQNLVFGNFSKPITNDEINGKIYGSNMKEAAFISYLLIPTFILISIVLLAFLGWIISLF